MTTKALSKEEILTAIKGMTVLDLAELVKALEQEFGVSAAAPVAVAAPGASAGGGPTVEEPEEEQTDFTVVLSAIGENKINVIKAVREVTSLGLKEAKDLVEAAPTNVKEAIGKEEADSLKVKLEGVGASVEIK